MFSYVFVVLFTSGEEAEITVRSTSEQRARHEAWLLLTPEEQDDCEDIDLVEVNA